MRQVFSSARLENVEAVAKLLGDADIEVRVTDGRSYKGNLRSRSYSEQEVNETLQRFHPDYAALRRYLVDDEVLTRDGGYYWRSGGTFEV